MSADVESNQEAALAFEKPASAELEAANGAGAIGKEENRRLLKRIDLRIMPVVSRHSPSASQSCLE